MSAISLYFNPALSLRFTSNSPRCRFPSQVVVSISSGMTPRIFLNSQNTFSTGSKKRSSIRLTPLLSLLLFPRGVEKNNFPVFSVCSVGFISFVTVYIPSAFSFHLIFCILMEGCPLYFGRVPDFFASERGQGAVGRGEGPVGRGPGHVGSAQPSVGRAKKEY